MRREWWAIATRSHPMFHPRPDLDAKIKTLETTIEDLVFFIKNPDLDSAYDMVEALLKDTMNEDNHTTEGTT